MKKVAVIIALCLLSAISSHVITLQSLHIETNGDGDSAIITSFGRSALYGINGYEVVAD